MRAHAALLVLFVSPTIVGAQGADLAPAATGPNEPGSLFCRAVIDPDEPLVDSYDVDDAYFTSPVRNTTWGAFKAMFLWGH
jgi:hypothetical protein